MSLSYRLRAAVLTAALSSLATTATAQQPLPRLQPCPPVPCPPVVLPPGTLPSQPGAVPAVPSVPATPRPGTPATPATPTPPATPPAATPPPAPGTPPPAPTPPATPPAADTPPPPSSDLMASATTGSQGGGSDFGYRPGIFGDLFGGATVPLAVQRFDAQGNPIGTVYRVLNPTTGRYVPVTGLNRSTDELLFGRTVTPQPVGTPVASTRVLENVDPAQLAAATRVPTISRGAFKITENETPRPTTRAYVTYNFYDNVFKSVGEDTPRVAIHQQMFGYEQAFADRQFSVGLRLPYNQLVSPGYYNDTSIGDLTIVTKGVIAENRCTGDLLSGGLAITVPTGARGVNSFSSANLRDTLLQPYLGYILTDGDLFLQGFSSLVVPTSSADVTLFTQSLALGYALYQRPTGALTGVYPVFEAHLNTPLNHRGSPATQVVYFPDTLTLLGGSFFELYSRSTLGFAAGAPVTGPRPFSLQATAQLSVRF